MPLGYHYTTEMNWFSIDKDGLEPYDLRKPEVVEALRGFKVLLPAPRFSQEPYPPLKAIWAWLKPQSGRELAGSLIFHALGKGCDRVVEIEISYAERERLNRPSDRSTITLYHDMNALEYDSPVGRRDPSYKYWHRGVEACLLKYRVPRERLRLRRLFDFKQCELMAVDGLHP